MRKALSVMGLLFIALSVLSFVGDELTERSEAKVEQIDGLYIFYQSKPTNETETLGSVKPGITLTGKPSELLDGLIKKAKKNFPQGEALLIGDIDMGRADVIKFKK